MITGLSARGIGVARISRKSKKEVQHHSYRLIFKYICLVVLFFHWCHFHEWIDTWITRRDQQYMEWSKKVDEDVRKCEREKAERAGRDKGTGGE